MCSNKGLLKRFIPFLLTFAAGLLIASFFVPILPNLSFGRGKQKHREWHKQLERENQRLAEENYNLTLQMDEMRQSRLSDDWSDREHVLPLVHEIPPPPPPPAAPVAPKKAR